MALANTVGRSTVQVLDLVVDEDTPVSDRDVFQLLLSSSKAAVSKVTFLAVIAIVPLRASSDEPRCT